MNDVQAKIDKLLDSRFVTDLLALRCDEGCIAALTNGFYLEAPDLETIRPLLDSADHHANVGQVGCYRARPVCPKANWKPNGQLFAEYQGILFTYWVYREVLPVSEFREWLQKGKEEASRKQPAFEALDTYETLAVRSTIKKEELAPILEAARSRYMVSWDIGMRFLSRLAAKHLTARECMADLMMTGKAGEKVHVLGALWDHLPKSFCVNLLRQGLKDRSKLVRQAAANVARCLVLTEMIDELCWAAAEERDPETKWQIEHAVALIRDGYHLYKGPDGAEAFVVRISDGFPAELLYPGPGWCTDADIKQKGPKAVAEEIRRQKATTDATRRPFNWPRE